MTSNLPPAAVPGPDDVPEWERDDAHTQPDPFGEPSDVEGAPDESSESEDARPKDDPRGQ